MEDVVQNNEVQTEETNIQEASAIEASSEVSKDSVELSETQNEGLEKDIAQKDAAPAYQPNYIFKAHGKDNELPEMFRGLIKDAETERQVKEIFEKAYGMENMREKNKKFEESLNYFEKELVPPLMKQHELVQEISSFIAKKDFDSAFELAGIDERDLQEWMYKKLSTRELPPEQQAIYNQNRELQRQQYEYEKKVRAYEEQQKQTMEQQHRAQLNSLKETLDFELSQPQIKEVVKNFDSQQGQGAFQTKVIKYAAFISQTEGRELSPKEAVQEFLKEFPQTNTLSSKPNYGSSSPKEKPVLPNPEAKPLSPVGNKPSNLKELRELAKSKYSEE